MVTANGAKVALSVAIDDRLALAAPQQNLFDIQRHRDCDLTGKNDTMKLNLADDQLRLRMSESDLERLLQEGRIDQNWACPDGSTAHCALTLTAMAPVSHCEGNLMNLRIDLPRTDFLAFARAWDRFTRARRPRRATRRELRTLEGLLLAAMVDDADFHGAIAEHQRTARERRAREARATGWGWLADAEEPGSGAAPRYTA